MCTVINSTHWWFVLYTFLELLLPPHSQQTLTCCHSLKEDLWVAQRCVCTSQLCTWQCSHSQWYAWSGTVWCFHLHLDMIPLGSVRGRSNIHSIYLGGKAKTLRSSDNSYIVHKVKIIQSSWITQLSVCQLTDEMIHTVIHMATVLGCIVRLNSLVQVNASISSVHQVDNMTQLLSDMVKLWDHIWGWYFVLIINPKFLHLWLLLANAHHAYLPFRLNPDSKTADRYTFSKY